MEISVKHKTIHGEESIVLIPETILLEYNEKVFPDKGLEQTLKHIEKIQEAEQIPFSLYKFLVEHHPDITKDFKVDSLFNFLMGTEAKPEDKLSKQNDSIEQFDILLE